MHVRFSDFPVSWGSRSRAAVPFARPRVTPHAQTLAVIGFDFSSAVGVLQ
jgi:hypothetical protein